MKAETNKSSSSEQGATSNPYLAHPGNSRNYDNKPSHQRIQLSAKRSSDAILGRRTGPSLTKVTRPKSRNEAPSRGKLPPGLYGNYVHYYTSRRLHGEKEDPRMSLMDSSLFTDKKVLDIGCNSGNLTILLALKHKPTHIDGVDIDEGLIKTAVNNLKSTYSLRDPESDTVDTDIGLTSHYYPQSMTFMFGFLPLMPREKAPPGFPYNIHFKSEDWLNMETEKQKYDTILALSISKWIHLHHGDDGIKKFFHKVYESLNDGGIFVLESQGFETYARRKKHSEHIKTVYDSIQFMPERFPAFLQNDVGFKGYEIVGESENEHKGFERPIYLFKK